MGESSMQGESGFERVGQVNLAQRQQDHQIAMQRAELALKAYMGSLAHVEARHRLGDSVIPLTTAELRSVLLPALGLAEEEAEA